MDGREADTRLRPRAYAEIVEGYDSVAFGLSWYEIQETE